MKTIHLLHNCLLLLLFFIRGYLITLITRDPVLLRKRLIGNTTRMARRFRDAILMKVSVKGMEHIEALRDSGYLLVSNHVSYLDIVLLSSLQPLVFITSMEMGANPVLGSITRLGGSLYTDRKKYISLPDEIAKFAACLKEGFRVVLFPEGTSTNGESVQEFRKSLFQVAIQAQSRVLPVCIRYRRIDGKKMDASNRDLVCWYGDMEFAPHFWAIMGHRSEVEIIIMPPLEYDPQWTRGELSDRVHRLIHDAYHADSV